MRLLLPCTLNFIDMNKITVTKKRCNDLFILIFSFLPVFCNVLDNEKCNNVLTNSNWSQKWQMERYYIFRNKLLLVSCKDLKKVKSSASYESSIYRYFLVISCLLQSTKKVKSSASYETVLYCFKRQMYNDISMKI